MRMAIISLRRKKVILMSYEKLEDVPEWIKQSFKVLEDTEWSLGMEYDTTELLQAINTLKNKLGIKKFTFGELAIKKGLECDIS